MLVQIIQTANSGPDSSDSLFSSLVHSWYTCGCILFHGQLLGLAAVQVKHFHGLVDLPVLLIHLLQGHGTVQGR